MTGGGRYTISSALAEVTGSGASDMDVSGSGWAAPAPALALERGGAIAGRREGVSRRATSSTSSGGMVSASGNGGKPDEGAENDARGDDLRLRGSDQKQRLRGNANQQLSCPENQMNHDRWLKRVATVDRLRVM